MTLRCHSQRLKTDARAGFYCIPPGMGLYSAATYTELCKAPVLLTKRLNGKALKFRIWTQNLMRTGSDTPLVNDAPAVLKDFRLVLLFVTLTAPCSGLY